MSKIDQIQNELKSINPAKMQKLGDSFLYQSLDAREINAVGTVPGEEKTRTGTPDSVFRLQNDKYVLVEYSTQKSDLLAKFSSDLMKCFDEEKTGIPLERVEKIVLACNSDLSHEEHVELIKICQENHCEVQFVELTNLSFELYHKYPKLAKEFLGIEIDSGQILRPNDFIAEYQKSKFATPLDNEFFFREREKSEILEALEKVDIVAVTGKAGVGKSKLSLEAARQFSEDNSQFDVFCISNKGIDIYEDTKAYLGGDGDYLVVVDDANRLSQLSRVLWLVREQTPTKRIKLLLTVRDYALRQIRDEVKEYDFLEIGLSAFTDEQIATILTESFEIKNHRFIERICNIAKGNPRLAFMAAELALDNDGWGRITDVTDLYDAFFSSIAAELNSNNEINLIKIAGIVSFFKSIDRTEVELFQQISAVFGLTVGELWSGLESLHALEFVDLNYEVAKVTDQVLGTYLFYKAFFKDEVAPLAALLNNFLDRFRYRLTDSLNSVFDAFDPTLIFDKLRPHVEAKWFDVRDDEAEALNFIKIFWPFDETKFLLYLRECIDSVKAVEVPTSELQFTPPSHQPITDKYLDVLRLFESSNIEIVLELIFRYLEKTPNILPQVIRLLTEDFCFGHQSYQWDYRIQDAVVSRLAQRAAGERFELYQRIILEISPKYLQMRFSSNSSNGMTVTIHNFLIQPSVSIARIREGLWKSLLELYEAGSYQSEVLQIIEGYSQGHSKEYTDEGIAKLDSHLLLPFVSSLDPHIYKNCVVANNYFDFLEWVGISFNQSLRTLFTNRTYQLSRILLTDDRRQVALGYEEFQAKKKELITNYFRDYNLQDFKDAFERCEEIQTTLVSQHEFHQLYFPLGIVLMNIADRDFALFREIFEYILGSGNKLRLPGYPIVSKIVKDTADRKSILMLLKRAEFLRKYEWIFTYFQELPRETIGVGDLEELNRSFEEASLREIPQSFEYLENYRHIDNDVYANAIKVLFARSNQEADFFNFHFLFNPFGETFLILESIFSDEIELLKALYLYQWNLEHHADHESKALRKICQLDREFIFEFLEYLYARERSYSAYRDSDIDCSFIWNNADWQGLFQRLFEFVYEHEIVNRPFWVGPSYLEIFFRNIESDTRDQVFQIFETLLREHINQLEKVHFIFQMVANLLPDKRVILLSRFLELNRDLDAFKHLPLHTSHIVSYSGSSIPLYETKITFFESLLPLFNSPDLLEHRLEIEEHLRGLKQSVEREKKRDFIGHY